MVFQRTQTNEAGEAVMTDIICDMVQPCGNLEGEDLNNMTFHLFRVIPAGYELILIVPAGELFTIFDPAV